MRTEKNDTTSFRSGYFKEEAKLKSPHIFLDGRMIRPNIYLSGHWSQSFMEYDKNYRNCI